VGDARRRAPEFIDRLNWSADRLNKHREDALKKLLRAAIARSPWHHERLAGLEPEAASLSCLAELPVMTKDDLMGNFDRIVTDPELRLAAVESYLDQLAPGRDRYLLGQYTAVASGGSSGRRGVFVYDWDAWTTLYLGLRRQLIRAVQNDRALGPVPQLISVASSHLTHAVAAFSRSFAGAHFTSRNIPVSTPLTEIVDALNQAQPPLLFGYPSALHLLAHEAEQGRLTIAPRHVVAGSEPLLPEIRSAVTRAWGAPILNTWGASEAGAVGVSCDQEGMHLSDDLLIVEPVDDQGRAVAPGGTASKLYLTNLYNHTLPLIRYELTDQVTIGDQPCPCGSAFRLVGDVQGRLDDVFTYGTLTVHPHLFRTRLGREGSIVEYQVCQTECGADIAIRAVGAVDLDTVRVRVTEDLRRLGLSSPRVTLTLTRAIDRGTAGKLKRFVPLTPRG
jgi:phenylacetate-coenzyme A ligase PaaK-like adenylate-forming protein